MATLVVVKGPAAGAKFALETHPLVMVGRDPRSTFQIVCDLMRDLRVSSSRNFPAARAFA